MSTWAGCRRDNARVAEGTVYHTRDVPPDPGCRGDRETRIVSQEALSPGEFLRHLQGEHQSFHWAPVTPAPATQRWRDDPLAGDESLQYLHQHWVLPDQASPRGRGLRGRLASRVGKVTFRVLTRYLDEERDLLGHMVRMNEALARRCDELALTVADQQVAEAANQARLAAWLHAEPPTGPQGQVGNATL